MIVVPLLQTTSESIVIYIYIVKCVVFFDFNKEEQVIYGVVCKKYPSHLLQFHLLMKLIRSI
jgi:hypothetical protein